MPTKKQRQRQNLSMKEKPKHSEPSRWSGQRAHILAIDWGKDLLKLATKG
jgi:hypothetical protein